MSDIQRPTTLRAGFHNTEFNDGNWNERGHEIAGEAIARELL